MTTNTLYKFLRTGLKSDNGDVRDWKIGEWRTEDKIEIRERGFHASKTPMQAFTYVGGEIIAEVEVRGLSVIEKDKECWSEMRIVKAWHWEKEDSVELAVFSAEQVIDIFEKKYPDDKRPRQAIKAGRVVVTTPRAMGKTTDTKTLAHAIDKWFIKKIKTLRVYGI